MIVTLLGLHRIWSNLAVLGHFQTHFCPTILHRPKRLEVTLGWAQTVVRQKLKKEKEIQIAPNHSPHYSRSNPWNPKLILTHSRTDNGIGEIDIGVASSLDLNRNLNINKSDCDDVRADCSSSCADEIIQTFEIGAEIGFQVEAGNPILAEIFGDTRAIHGCQ